MICLILQTGMLPFLCFLIQFYAYYPDTARGNIAGRHFTTCTDLIIIKTHPKGKPLLKGIRHIPLFDHGAEQNVVYVFEDPSGRYGYSRYPFKKHQRL